MEKIVRRFVDLQRPGAPSADALFIGEGKPLGEDGDLSGIFKARVRGLAVVGRAGDGIDAGSHGGKPINRPRTGWRTVARRTLRLESVVHAPTARSMLDVYAFRRPPGGGPIGWPGETREER